MEFPLAAHNVSCSRVLGAGPTQIVNVTTAFEPATLNLLLGASGSGKNLLLRMLALLEAPDQGEIVLSGKSTRDWTLPQRADARSRNFGFVFEAPFLLPSFNVIENIAMPLFKLTGVPPEEAREHTNRVLDFVGMSDCAECSTEQLPIWAQLRISLARALVIQPLVLFVENLDTVLHGEELIPFLELLAAARRIFGCCVLVTAADPKLASFCNRALEFNAGQVTQDWNPGRRLS